MVEFKKKADKIIKERWGIDVEHMCAMVKEGDTLRKATYEYYFYKPRTFTKHKDKPIPNMYGFPYQKGPWCNDRLKMNALKQIPKKEVIKDADGNTIEVIPVIRYVGIATDEPKRLARLDKDNSVSPLKVIGWNEAECRKWCEENDLLSPIYYRYSWWMLVLPLSTYRPIKISQEELS